MLSPIKYSGSRNEGLNGVVPAGPLGLLSLDLLVLGQGKSFDLDTLGTETAIVPLSGAVEASLEGRSYTLSRKDVFTEKASALCAPKDSKIRIRASAHSELALCRARTEKKGRPLYIPKESVREKTVGKENWKRKVVDIIPSDAPASRIVLGETFNAPGGWSSFPPHKHDTFVPGMEARMEEVYLFRLNPSGGFGTQTVYGEQGSFSFKVEDYDAVAIPWGYHPVSAMPGYEIYYLWFLAGDGRTLMPNTDPRYRWLEEK